MPTREEQIARIKQIERIRALEGKSSAPEQPSQSVDNLPIEALPPGYTKAGLVTMRAAQNLLPSLAKNVGGMVEAVSSPIETIKQIGKVGLGAARGLVGAGDGSESDQAWQQMKEMLVKRYGSEQALMKTISEDPVGFAMDVSTVAGGAGAGLRGVGAVAKAPRLAAVGKGLSEVAAVVDPISAIPNVAKAIVPAALPTHLWQNAIKYPKSVKLADRARDFVTAAENKVIPNARGMQKAKDIISEINSTVNNDIVAAAKSGRTIEARSIVQRLNGLREWLGETPLPKTTGADALEVLKQEFLEAHGKKIPVDKAMKIKQHAYQLLDGKYGEMQGVVAETQKQIARGIREEMLKEMPQLKILEKEGRLVALTRAIEDVVKRSGNKDMLGYGSSIGMYGAATGNVPLMSISGFKMVMDNPVVKSRLAFALKSARESAPKRRVSAVTTPATVLTREEND